MAQMSTSALQAILQSERADALSGMNASKLADERATALDYYNGDMSKDMPAPPDRSKAVSTDVADTVEGLMPWMMDILAGSDEVVRFEPVGPEDEPAAEQESDYVNHVFMQKNGGFMVIYAMVKDALLSKTGLAKVWYDKGEKRERETYYNQPEASYGLLVQNPAVEIVAHSEHTDDVSGEAVHDVTIIKKRGYGCAKVEAMAPEEFGIARRAKSIQDSGYCYHETTTTESDLIDKGYDAEQVRGLATGETEDDAEESDARDTVEETSGAGAAAKNKATRPIVVTEHYIKLDYEDNGQAELYKVVTAGASGQLTILKRDGQPDIEPMDFVPIAAMTPIVMPHRFFGRSVADQVLDIQRIKTALQRAMLDNVYLANNQRIEIAEANAGPYTIDDLLSNRPGGIVRTKMPGGLAVIPNQPIGNFVFPMIEYMDATREWRTGVTRQGQGIDANALQNQTAEAVSKVYSAAQARMKLIARVMAEGLRDLFWILHATIRKNETSANTVRLRNEWKPVDPRTWKTRDDLTINVGLGSGTKDQQMAFLMQLLGIQKEILMAPSTGLATPQNVYNTLKKVTEIGGLKNVDPYFTDPAKTPPQPPPPDPEMVKVQGQLEAQKAKNAGELQLDTAKSQNEMALESMKQQGEMKLQSQKLEAEMALKREQIAAEIALKRELGYVDAAVQANTPDVKVGGDPG